MANFSNNHTLEGKSTTRPPFFDGLNYTYWKNRMQIFLCAQNIEEWKSIRLGYTPPTHAMSIGKSIEDYDRNELDAYSINCKAMNSIICALSPSEYNKISACETAKSMWDKLSIIHEGTSQVKDTKISMLVHDYELFKVNENETINDMFSRFTNITNELKRLGKIYSSKDLVTKILRSLPRRWESKVTAIQEAKDLNILSLDDLLGSLTTHEIILNNQREEDESKMKDRKVVAFKSKISNDDSQ